MAVGGSRISVLPGDRLGFARYEPDPALRGFVDTYWSLDVDQPPAPVDLVPDGMVDVTFEYGDRVGAFVTGPLTTPVRYLHERITHLLGVSLLPGVALPVLGVSVATLTPEWTPLASIVGPIGAELTGRVAAESTMVARLALLDTFLVARLRAVTPDRRVAGAVEVIDARDGNVAIAALAQDVAASPRNLTRLFDEWIGLGPKRFARIVRAQAALRRLAQDPGTDLAALAADLGFADQAHLSRELRDLAGSNPTGLAARLSAEPGIAGLFG